MVVRVRMRAHTRAQIARACTVLCRSVGTQTEKGKTPRTVSHIFPFSVCVPTPGVLFLRPSPRTPGYEARKKMNQDLRLVYKAGWPALSRISWLLPAEL